MTATMDHEDATLTGAAERYILGDMAADERERYEAHFFVCAECADEVRAAARFVDAARPIVEMQAARPASPARAPIRDAKPSWWMALAASLRPLPLAAAATIALAAAVAYQALVVIPGLRQQLQEADGLQTAPSYFLSIARGDAPVIAVGDERIVIVTLSRTFDRVFPFYSVAVQDQGGRTIASKALRGPAAGEELQLRLPVHDLAAGSYAVVVAGLDSETSATPASDSVRYPFRIERRSPPR